MKTYERELSNLLQQAIAESRRRGIPMPDVIFGRGSINQLPGTVTTDTVVVVTDQALAATPVMDAVRRVLAGKTVILFDELRPNPSTDMVAAGSALVRRVAQRVPVTVVAVGGGSTLDAGTVIAQASPALRPVMVPTTAGTGAEMNDFGVITNPNGVKAYMYGLLAGTAILDPQLTDGLPARGTAATGIDALTHATESLLSIRANDFSDRVALRVIPMIMTYLPRAVADGDDAEARSHMQAAACLAGIGMAGTGLGILHAGSHPLAPYNIAHGEGLAMLMKGGLNFNLPVCTRQLAKVAFACGFGNAGRSEEWNAGAAVQALTALPAQIGITCRLRQFGIMKEDLGQIAEKALRDPVLENTPRRPTKGELIGIFAGAY